MSRTPTPPDLEGLQSDIPVPGATLPAPTDMPSHEVTPSDAFIDTIDDAVVHALRAHDPRTYMEKLAREKPELFYKYVALVVQSKAQKQGPSRTGTIISPLAPSPLDRPMQ